MLAELLLILRTGILRVHLPPESLPDLKVKLDDLVDIKTDDGTTRSAIAWRASDGLGKGNQKVKPVKMSDGAREAFNLREGTLITISKASNALSRAGKVVLRDVTPREYLEGVSDIEDGAWKVRCHCAMVNARAIATGLEFDVFRSKAIKKRFRIESIQSPVAECNLYRCDDTTQIAMSELAPSEPLAAGTIESGSLLTSERIGGLQREINKLNARLRQTLGELCVPGGYINGGILLHGFGGTGKSHILRELRRAPFRKVIDLKRPTGSTSGTRHGESIRESFKAAKGSQPSLILIDDIDKLAPVTQDNHADVLVEEMDLLRDSRVLVVAACRSPSDISSTLLKAGRLGTAIELRVPDSTARRDILGLLLRHVPEGHDLARQLALRSHGYTGDDLTELVHKARFAILEEQHTLRSSSANASKRTTNGDGHDSEHQFENSQRLKLTMECFETALAETRPAALREIVLEPPKVKWEDIGGSEQMKKRFDKIIGWPLYHENVMKRFHARPEKGVLLYGPPGCSKTLTAQAVACHYELNFIAIKGAELVSMYVGESERKIRELFQKARRAAPCVIFFDEIDSIAAERETGSSKGLNVLTTLLNEMDGFEELKGVLVLAATNKPGVLDPAIMRPGRFGQHIFLGPPSATARREIFGISLKGIPVEEGIDFDGLASETENRSGMLHLKHHSCSLYSTNMLRRRRDRTVVPTSD
jgi:AAA family ATPase